MHGLMENAIYGGRVDNTFDVRVLFSYLEQIFNEFVITGQASTPTRGGVKKAGLAFGNIPVSMNFKVNKFSTVLNVTIYSNTELRAILGLLQ